MSDEVRPVDPVDAEEEKMMHALTAALDRRRISFYQPYPKQKIFHDAGGEPGINERLLMAGNQLGKELQNETPVLTRSGWKPIGAIQVDEEVFAEDGTLTVVTGVYPQGIVPLYRMTFDRGESILAGANHLWKYRHPKHRDPTRHSHGKSEPNPNYGPWSVGSTQDLLSIGGSTPAPRRRAVMPVTQPLQFSSQSVPIHPYILGLLLGDGYLGATVMLSSADEEIISSWREYVESFGYRIRTDRGINHHASGNGSTNRILTHLRELGLSGTRSATKFIPSCYLFNDCETRLALLQGLLDTDGSVSQDGAIEYSTVSPDLAEGVRYLVQSFGGKVAGWKTTRQTRYTYNGMVKDGQPSWRLRIRLPHVDPFRLPRKLRRCFVPTSTCDERVLVSIHPEGEGHATCISVAHPSSTYLIEHCLVTHNTLSAAAETTYHATGEYPKWWKGRRFNEPTQGWVSGTTSQTTRDNPQRLLMGQVGEWGTGMIPAKAILDIKKQIHGVSDSIETVLVRHTPTKKISRITFKTYDQGRERWQGETLHYVWFDEEPPLDIYSEGKTRTQVKNGIVYMTFTPLLGMSDVVLRFLKEKPPGTRVIGMTIYDALHYTTEQREAIIAGYPEHEREARAMGIPIMGSGVVFPVPESTIKIPAFSIPAYWPRLVGMDIGYTHPTAAAWLAWDKDTDVVYVYEVYRLKEASPVIHAAAIKGRGAWIPVAWPHDALQHDKGGGCEQIAKQYREQGVKMLPQKATHAPEKGKKEGTGGYSVEAGIQMMLQRMQTGRFRVFEHLNDWFEEFRFYHRKDGLIVKERDDLMSATRTGMMMLRHAKIYVPNDVGPRVPAYVPSDSTMGVLG